MLTLSGCQLVFGLDGYETGEGAANASGAGGAGAAPSNGGGVAQGGAGGQSGCECDLPAGWKIVKNAATGPTSGTIPTACANGGILTVLYSEPPSDVVCSACVCSQGGCELPSVTCYRDQNCGGAVVVPAVSQSCSAFAMLGDSIDSCRASGDVTPIQCTPTDSSGVPQQTYDFAQFSAFCTEATCGEDDCTAAADDCALFEGTVAGECPPGFPEKSTLNAAGSASCEACACTGDCGTPLDEPYRFGTAGCDTVINSSCKNEFFLFYFGQSMVSPSCADSAHPAPYPGTFTPEKPYTLCCKAPPGPTP